MNVRRFPRSLAFVVLVLALGVCLPASAQRMSTSDRLTALEQQLSAMRSGNLDLLNQIGDLKSEVQSLRGQVEELQQQLEQQKQASKTQYLDLDSRLARLEGGDAPANAAPAPVTPAVPVPATPASVPPATPAAAPATSQEPAPRVYGDSAAFTGRAEDERGAYNQAFDALKAGHYADASRAFQAFLDAYPNGVFTPNAFYWLGESYYVTQNYALALEQFQTLLNRYPTHDKAAGALLKVGLCQYGLRQLDAAQVTLSKVVSRYPGTEAARSADDRLRAIQLSRVK